LTFKDRAPILGCSATKASDFSSSSAKTFGAMGRFTPHHCPASAIARAQDYGSINDLTPLNLPDGGE